MFLYIFDFVPFNGQFWHVKQEKQVLILSVILPFCIEYQQNLNNNLHEMEFFGVFLGFILFSKFMISVPLYI